jgi:hypothetical protein
MWKNLDLLVKQATADASQNAGAPDMVKKKDNENDDFDFDENDEWIQKTYAVSPSRTFNARNISITLGEEAAEKYILGESHWEYSKVISKLCTHLLD